MVTIGELARAASVPISTLRFYERRGLLSASTRTRAGYRQFTEEDAARVRFLRRAQELGFTLAELREMLALSRKRVVIGGEVAERGNAKLAEIDDRIADLRRVRGALAKLLAAQCTDPDAPCPIVAALAETPPPRRARTNRG
ncbi:MAG: MerR family transcriptional regulator [Polyangiales bacterium]